MDLLAVNDLRVSFDGIEALKGISFGVGRGAIVALVGNNGAGKSTLLKTISGLCRSHAGEILFEGRSITSRKPHEIAALGLRHVPEGRRIFGRLTVCENLDMGAFTRRDRHEVAADLTRVLELFPILKARWNQLAGTLSGGEQQMLAIGRALMGQPRILMLDEPSMGLSPLMVEHVFESILAICDQGVTTLLVEQNALLALSIADVGHVLESGRILLSGPGPSLCDDERVRSAYLG
jgi:branched-chain amino acid transport system ATP-binding protein